jgi:protein O-mannosyl-transferase
MSAEEEHIAPHQQEARPSDAQADLLRPQARPQFAPQILLMLFAFLLYGNTLRNGFALDDVVVITENTFTKKGIEGLGDIFTTDAFVGFYGEQKDVVEGGRYRPLSIATFAVEVSLFGSKEVPLPKPGISHLINILLYGLCGIMVFAFLRQLFPTSPASKWWTTVPFWVALLYLSHPIHTEVVANIKGRDELLAFLFLLVALYGVLRYVDRQSYGWLMAGSVSFFLSLLAKESPLPFVLILPLTILIFRPRATREQLLMGTGAMVLATAIYLVIRLKLVGLGGAELVGGDILYNPLVGVGFADRTATIAETMGIYLEKLLFPYGLSHEYGYNQVPIVSWRDWQAIVPAIGIIALVVAGIGLSVRRNPIGYGILFFLLSFSITSNLAVSIGALVGERFVFIPSLGIVIAMVVGLQRLGRRRSENVQKWVFGAIMVVSALFGVRTFVRNFDWKDNLTLFTADSKNSPNSAKVHTAAGATMEELALQEQDSLKKAKLLADAQVYLNRAIEIYPKDAQPYLFLGLTYNQLRRHEAAIQAYEMGIMHNPDLWTCYTNEAVAARALKRHDIAANVYRRLAVRQQIAVGEVDGALLYQMGENFADWQQPDSAVIYFENALDADPNNAEAMAQLADVYAKQLANPSKAIEMGEQAVAIDPELEMAWACLGQSYQKIGQDSMAAVSLQRGIQVNPKAVLLFWDLALLYQRLGDMGNAKENFKQAFMLDPKLMER